MYLVVWTKTAWVGNGNLTVVSGAKLFNKPENVKRFSRTKWAEGCETTWFKWSAGGVVKGAGVTAALSDEEFKAIDNLTA